MFGGFDGNFFNDVNILGLKKENNTVAIPKSTVSEDYFSLVNNAEGSDISFKLNDPSRTCFYGHRALILFRLLQRELSVDVNENMPLQTMVASNQVPEFIKRVSQVQLSLNTKIQLFLNEVTCPKSFLFLLEFFYCDRFISHLTYNELNKVMDLAQILKIHKTQEIF